MLINNLIIKLLNNILINNQGSLNLLKKFNQQSFSISAIGLFKINAIIQEDGLLKDIDTTDYTTYISIPLSISTYLLDNKQIEAIKNINIQGNKEFGMNILNIFSNLQLEYNISSSSFANSIIFNILKNFINTIKSSIGIFIQNTGQSITEYIQYETQDIVSYYEIEQFCNNVDELKEKTELLLKRFNLLDKKLP